MRLDNGLVKGVAQTLTSEWLTEPGEVVRTGEMSLGRYEHPLSRGLPNLCCCWLSRLWMVVGC